MDITYTDYTEMRREAVTDRLHESMPYIAVGATAMETHFATAARRGLVYDRVDIFGNFMCGYIPDSRKPQGIIQIPYVGPHGDRTTSASTYLRIPVFNRTATLHIDHMLDGIMISDLTCFQNVRYLELEKEAAAVFWAALTGNAANRSQPAGVDACRPFPALARISIIRFDFDMWPGTTVMETFVPRDFASLLARALREVYLPSETFEGVVFENCTIGQDKMNAFKEALGTNRVHMSSRTSTG